MYLTLKTLHILSSTLLFGTGLGTAFFMWMTNRTKDRAAITVVTKIVVKADLYFTTPSVVLQPLTGVAMMLMAGYPLNFASLNWLGLSVMLYVLAGVCWLPVLWIQLQMHHIALGAPSGAPLPPSYWVLERYWVLLGIPAFSGVIAVFWLMTAKPF